MGEQDTHLIAGGGTGAEGPHSGTIHFIVLILAHALLSPLGQQISLEPLPDSLETNPKIAGSQAVENGGRSIARQLAACRCGGNLGPNCFIARLPASCPAFPSGLPSATPLSLRGSSGELTLLMYVSPLPTLQCIYSALPHAMHSSHHFSSSRSCLKSVFC